MLTLIKDLFFDEELVNRIKAEKPNEGVLYAQLLEGRITLREYIAAH